mmetsp:Transcript_2617/g.4676  ORF Transcript_2617/g.4676 Transcript_2617/m.4676 type:complete len:357 (+) Transcript_2617:160-1230(+)
MRRNLHSSVLLYIPVLLPLHGQRLLPTHQPRISPICRVDNSTLDDGNRRPLSNHAPVSFKSSRRPSFNAKQSLGQNFLVDDSVALRMVDAFSDAVAGQDHPLVVEIGPGTGSLTRFLLPRFPNMKVVEIDQRCIDYLEEHLSMPGEQILHRDVLDVNWAELSEHGRRVNVIGNLPFYIVSQIMLSLFEQSKHVNVAMLTMQKEVAERVTSTHQRKAYGILSVMAQLHSVALPKILFDIPGSAFRPRPDVTSTVVQFNLDRSQITSNVSGQHFRTVLKAAFQQRRKVLRNSVKALVAGDPDEILGEWASKRAEQLAPYEFIELTKKLFGSVGDIDELGDSFVWTKPQHNLLDFPGKG